MSKLYNYFVSCWKYNPNFTTINLDNAVAKDFLKPEEATAIKGIERLI